MNVTKQPYRIVIVPSISREPSNEQMNWMVRQLRMLVKCSASLELAGDVQVLVYPMARVWENGLPHWAKFWTRPQGCSIDPLGAVQLWQYADPRSVVLESLARGADEVWCLNELGHSQMSPCPQAKIWRAAQETTHAARFKLVPSWVNSDEPERPVKKEKRNANGNVSGASAPARKAGGGGTTRGGSRGNGPYGDSRFPRRGR